MKTKFYKISSVIRKGENQGVPIYSEGAPVRFLGLPVTENGQPAMGGTMSFEGSFDGTHWFTINDSGGNRLNISPRALQQVIPENGLKPAPAILPISNSSLFQGIQMIRPVINAAAVEEQTIDFYLDT